MPPRKPAASEDQVERSQLNVRVTPELEQLIEKKRVGLMTELGYIPSRSEVVRLAIEAFVGAHENDKRSPAKSKK
jgi:Arc/MetJ-type ribon-helix-helix transcriptional regulator